MNLKWKQILLMLLALVLTFSFTLAGCSSDDPDSDRDEDEREEERDDEDEDDEDEPVYETREVYLCVRTSMEQWDSGAVFVNEYEYDEYGNRIRDTNNTSGSYTEYTYDADGNQIRSQYFRADGTPGSTTDKTYDDAGRILSSIAADASGELSSEYFYSYDETGHLVEETRTQHYNGTQYRYVFSYNSDYTYGKIDTYENDVWIGYTEESYDADGNLLRSDSYDAEGGWKSGMECAYDQEGRIAVEWNYSKSETQADYDVVYTYDANGLLVYRNVDYYYGYGMTYEYELFTIQVRVD